MRLLSYLHYNQTAYYYLFRTLLLSYHLLQASPVLIMSEFEPLLANSNVDAITSKRQGILRFREKYLLSIIHFAFFLFLCGENIQPAPRTQIYEVIICHHQHGDDITVLHDNICKGQDVQEELAFLEGMERLLGALPSNTISLHCRNNPYSPY